MFYPRLLNILDSSDSSKKKKKQDKLYITPKLIFESVISQKISLITYELPLLTLELSLAIFKFKTTKRNFSF